MTLLRLFLVLTLAGASACVTAQDSAETTGASTKKPAETSAATTSNDPRVRGAYAFTDNGCQQCHTIHNSGGKKGPDLSAVGRRLNDAQIRAQIMNGGKQMPPFADILQLTEADDLVAYLHSLRDKEKKSK